MDRTITRKFYKPLKGKGELRKSSQHFANVSYLLQGWRDFKDNEIPDEQGEGDQHCLSGMDGEIVLDQEDRKKTRAEEIVGQEFTLHMEKEQQLEVLVYKLKDDDPTRGRYSVRCKIST